jgi:hypothetical protein
LTDGDALCKLASAYSHAAFKIVKALERSLPRQSWTEAVADAVDWDVVQNDWNGSAKAARLGIAESSNAWRAVLEAGEAAADSPLGQILALLDRIDGQLAARFPLAMQFVRPGFDEPEVAAGALSSLECFEPRPR